MNLIANTPKLRNAIVFDIILPHEIRGEVVSRMEETESLLKTYGGITHYKIIQRRFHASRNSYIGLSKLEELLELGDEIKADLLIINDTLLLRQIYAIEEIIEKKKKKIEVWDRVDLILMIFSKHAKTAEAKLQLELARIEHFGPRIYGMGTELSQQGAGIGTRGTGETNTEIMKRHLSKQKKIIKDRLKKLEGLRNNNLKRRKKNGFKCISIVGYTNAGKSHLFTTLSKRNVLIKDELFATLDTTTTRLYLSKTQQTVLISDTIGFIRNLPPTLINAFKSTLLETIESDLLIQVIDTSDEEFISKIKFVEEIIHDINAQSIPMLYLFNKVDLLGEEKIAEVKKWVDTYSGIMISAKENINLDLVKKRIEQILFPDLIHSMRLKEEKSLMS
ncbi:GTPase HflX-like [Ylistrum balloti]|uniref:GTPase HflX-like n=1 Tax=Ylistrum balloti TaxID=509963 RepID=UPI0029058EC9|nr:GTPase HflX-like [Ylistrum balloti]